MKRTEAITHVIGELRVLKDKLSEGKSVTSLEFLTLSEIFKFNIEPKSERFTAICLDEAAKINSDKEHLKLIQDILDDELEPIDDTDVEEVNELIDFDGSMVSSKIPPGTDGNKTIGARKTTDDKVKATSQAGVWTGGGHYFKRYYGESVEEIGEHDMSEVLGFEDTEFKNAEETIKYFETEHDMDEIEAAERAESMGKTKNLDDNGQQRLTEKEKLKKVSEEKARNMIEVILSNRDEDMDIKSSKSTLLDTKIKQLLRLADTEGLSIDQLISKIKS
jgi:hypothetical protein|tara:strand:+ start:4536 stop:5366 length:831 start_codon:yes stop_codon:yes gene_type:complete